MTRYRVSGPIPAIYHTPKGTELRVTLPAGAVLVESVQQPRRLVGILVMYWERRPYSVHRRDLLKKAARVSTA